MTVGIFYHKNCMMNRCFKMAYRVLGIRTVGCGFYTITSRVGNFSIWVSHSLHGGWGHTDRHAHWVAQYTGLQAQLRDIYHKTGKKSEPAT